MRKYRNIQPEPTEACLPTWTYIIQLPVDRHDTYDQYYISWLV